MPIMEWNDNLSVNIKQIDSQHQTLIKLINELFDSMKLGKGYDVLGKIITELFNYTKTHFGTEEKYFEQFKYPEIAVHKIEHKKFIDHISKFKAEFEAKTLGLSVPIMNFLIDWLKNHIQVSDKKYGPFLNQHGLK